jgi:hypothetical protein
MIILARYGYSSSDNEFRAYCRLDHTQGDILLFCDLKPMNEIAAAVRSA